MNGKYPPSLTLPERYSIDVLYVNQSALVFPEIVTSSPKRFASSCTYFYKALPPYSYQHG